MDISEWGANVPGRPDDWPPLEPIDPAKGRELAQWLKWSAGSWASSGRDDLARSNELLADATLAEVEAVENEDFNAWVDALGAQSAATRLGHPPQLPPT